MVSCAWIDRSFDVLSGSMENVDVIFIGRSLIKKGRRVRWGGKRGKDEPNFKFNHFPSGFLSVFHVKLVRTVTRWPSGCAILRLVWCVHDTPRAVFGVGM